MEARLKDCLKERQIPDNVIEQMEKDKINVEAIYLMKDSKLETYIPDYGDKIVIREKNAEENNEKNEEEIILDNQDNQAAPEQNPFIDPIVIDLDPPDPPHAPDVLNVIDLDPPDILTVRLRRISILEDVIHSFESTPTNEIMNKKIKVIFINHRGEEETGEDMNGLFREAMTLFCNRFYDKFTDGGTRKVPDLHHSICDKWRVIGLIFRKGYEQAKYFPIKISEIFMEACILRKAHFEPDRLLEGLLQFLSVFDATTLRAALRDWESVECDDVIEVLTNLKCSNIPGNSIELRKTLIGLANEKLIQEPKYVIDEWENVMGGLMTEKELREVYLKLEPTVSNIISLFPADETMFSKEQAMFYDV